MVIDDKNYRDGLAFRSRSNVSGWLRRSAGETYTLQVGHGAMGLLMADEIVSLGEALVKYGKERMRHETLVTTVKGA